MSSKNQGLGMLVSMAIGDALGAGREFVDPSLFQGNDLEYCQNPKWPELKPGRYTDDTQMAVAVAEILLMAHDGQVSLTTLNLANYFLNAFGRDPRHGYAQGFYDILMDVPDGVALLDTLKPHSTKSGGAMRAAPCGLLGTEQECIDKAMWQASLTHATRDGMTAAAGAALLVWACRHGVPRQDLAIYLTKFLPEYPWWARWDEPQVSTLGLDAVHAALTAIQQYDGMAAILRQCIAFTGDTDTVAAIAMAAASLHPDIKQDLPLNLLDQLESGEFGQAFLFDLDDRLMKAFPITHRAQTVQRATVVATPPSITTPPQTHITPMPPKSSNLTVAQFDAIFKGIKGL